MGAIKCYYEEIAATVSDEELRRNGWTEEQIEWLRKCFGYPKNT